MHVSRSNDKDISKFDVCALFFSYRLQIFDTDLAGLKCFVVLAMPDSPLVVIEQDAASTDTLLSPGSNAVDVGLFNPISAVDIVKCDTIIELLLLLIPEMSQSVPLAR